MLLSNILKFKFSSKPVLLLITTAALTLLMLSSGSLVAQSDQPISNKLCSGIVPGNYRDTINVPYNWSPRTCRDFANSIGAETYQLGCITDTSFVWGQLGGGRPFSDCGW